jgi:hypothetical protein
MNECRTLLRYHDLSVEVESTPGNELMEHMNQTIMGQPGGFRYRHTDLEDRMKAGDENYFMYLRKSGKMLGSVGFCGKPTETEGFAHDSWLIRYFSIKAPMRTVPKKRRTDKDLKGEDKRTTVLGRFIQPIFADPTQLREGENRKNAPSIIFATIDQTNLRSMNFSAEMGLETIGKFAAFSFSRMNPRKSERIEPVNETERGVVLDQIREYYKGYTLFFPDAIFKNNDYYVIKKEGRMVAGLQIYRVAWKIVDMGNRVANISGRLITRIPWFRKRFNGDELRFLAFDAVYCEPGYEPVLYELMEGVLERTGYYFSMMMMDTESALYRQLRKHKKWGILHKIVGTAIAEIRVRFINIPDDIRQKFYERPTYIPTYDNS